MKRMGIHFATALLGLIMISAGFYLLSTLEDPQGMMRSLPYIAIGLGCGFLGHGSGEWIRRKVMKEQPDLVKRIEIEQQDERNLAIGNRSKAKAYDLMVYVFGALLLAFTLLDVQLAAILLLASSYLLVIAYGIYKRQKYEKEM